MELRLANQEVYSSFDGFYEIMSIAGTISMYGSHLHLSVSGEDGRKIGGHIESGCKICTTAEIVVAVFDEVVYQREYAEESGYEELVVYGG